MKRKKRKMIFNDDGTVFSENQRGYSEQYYKDFIFGPLKGSMVDTLFYSFSCGNVANYDSKVLPPDETHNWYRYKNYLDLKKADTSMFDIVINGARKNGLDIFMSFRVNDHHDHLPEYRDFLASFKKEHPEWLLPREFFPDYMGNCPMDTSLDFSIKEVRELKKNAIRELMEGYDFDGLELDFMRNQLYFHWDKGVGSQYIMTDFVRDIRKMLDEIGAKREKYLELAVRVCTTVVGSEMAGFDVGKWADQGLIDIVIAGTGSMEIDTKGFKKLLEGTGVSFFPCLYGDYERVSSSDEVMRGISEALLMDEPDGLYLFNTYPVQRGREQLMSQIGSLESLKGLDKTYIVDTDYDYRYLTHEEWRYMLNLPAVLGETDTEGLEIPIKVWDCPGRYDNAKVSLRIWIKGLTQEDDISFDFNDKLLCYSDARRYPVKGQYLENWIEWDVEKEIIRDKNILKIKLKKQNGFVERYMQLTVQRVNIKVRFE